MKLAILANEKLEFVLNIFNKHLESNITVTMIITRDENQKIDSNLPIYSMSKFISEKSNEVDGIFIITKQVGFTEMDVFNLYNRGIENIYIPYPIVIEQELDFLKENQFLESQIYKPKFAKPFLYRLETHVVDRCNLNCNGCNNMTPIDPGLDEYSIDNFKRDMQTLSDKFDNICIIGLQGGEPLLDHHKTLEFASISRDFFPLSDIRVLTNGLLIPKIPDNFFQELSKLNITIHLSVYTPTEKIMNEIIAKLEKNKINYFIAGYGKKEVFYKRLTLEPNEDAEYNNYHCISTNIHYLKNGQIWKCPSSCLVKNLDYKFDTKLYQESGLDITRYNSWDIITQLNNPCYLCQYCSLHKRESFAWTNKKEHILSDWIIK